jgi:hypothetical protein
MKKKMFAFFIYFLLIMIISACSVQSNAKNDAVYTISDFNSGKWKFSKVEYILKNNIQKFSYEKIEYVGDTKRNITSIAVDFYLNSHDEKESFREHIFSSSIEYANEYEFKKGFAFLEAINEGSLLNNERIYDFDFLYVSFSYKVDGVEMIDNLKIPMNTKSN